MRLATSFPEGSKPSLWSGHSLRGLSSLFPCLDEVMKLLNPAPVVEDFGPGFTAELRAQEERLSAEMNVQSAPSKWHSRSIP